LQQHGSLQSVASQRIRTNDKILPETPVVPCLPAGNYTSQKGSPNGLPSILGSLSSTNFVPKTDEISPKVILTFGGRYWLTTSGKIETLKTPLNKPSLARTLIDRLKN